MPELPEVETIARRLRPALVGHTIRSVDLRWEKTLAVPSPGSFRRQLPGQQVQEISRRGKYLTMQLTSHSLLIHLRMSGDLWIKPQGYQPQAYDRLILGFSNDRVLAFNDTRKFGRVWFTREPDQILKKLGPEPLDAAFTAGWLYEALHSRHRQLKPLLLDQTFLAGLGNIYTDEALHLSGLHPLRRSDTINGEETDRLYAAVRFVLEEGIAHNGSSIDWVYRGGEFQNYFRVYARTGEPCPVCGNAIQRIVVGQRGTHLCSTCQLLG
ncbi:MAG: bifunctional DNA-formamidopyrimidine glycosylase/DNA-(apurinic or apyrimidinic site) lyase [Anaerolineales bacterium]|nr:bifunctional DNA-formamidopyrimidine glycosylase/DNA-(apurinic or apyrimidinic site) lyase [Anaerolineales bacterium]